MTEETGRGYTQARRRRLPALGAGDEGRLRLPDAPPERRHRAVARHVGADDSARAVDEQVRGVDVPGGPRVSSRSSIRRDSRSPAIRGRATRSSSTRTAAAAARRRRRRARASRSSGMVPSSATSTTARSGTATRSGTAAGCVKPTRTRTARPTTSSCCSGSTRTGPGRTISSRGRRRTHPTLGEVEVGGWNPKFWSQNPPPEMLETWARNEAMFNLYLAQQLAQVRVVSATSQAGRRRRVRNHRDGDERRRHSDGARDRQAREDRPAGHRGHPACARADVRRRSSRRTGRRRRWRRFGRGGGGRGGPGGPASCADDRAASSVRARLAQARRDRRRCHGPCAAPAT